MSHFAVIVVPIVRKHDSLALTGVFTVAELDTLETLCEAAAEVHGDSFNALRIQPQLLQMSLSSRPLSCIRVFYNHLWQLHVCAGV